ncbi:MAG: nucleoside triphosphate pyrophosphohydrolase [Candidatus Methanomethylophilaceae archaeon]|jgi:predicted house-cleaning noncanonical NTP pyrophosphatase (MazG superfamily)
MVTTEYNKLVRDKIPAIITAEGGIPNFRMLDDGEYLEALHAKLLEEVDEYMKSRELEELADVFQVIVSISEAVAGGQRELEYLADEKRRERGVFAAHIFLESVTKNS